MDDESLQPTARKRHPAVMNAAELERENFELRLDLKQNQRMLEHLQEIVENEQSRIAFAGFLQLLLAFLAGILLRHFWILDLY